jgi:hypothetical protein
MSGALLGIQLGLAVAFAVVGLVIPGIWVVTAVEVPTILLALILLVRYGRGTNHRCAARFPEHPYIDPERARVPEGMGSVGSGHNGGDPIRAVDR